MTKRDQKWILKIIDNKGELPTLSISLDEKRFSLPNLSVLSPDKSIRLRFLDEAVSDVNLPNSVSEPWRDILSERALEDDEVDAFHSEFLDTPVIKTRSINRDAEIGQGSISLLVPHSRIYFERLVGVYDGSTSIP